MDMKQIEELPSGARFCRCALQVNPFAYLSRHSEQTFFSTEIEYNAAILAACPEPKIPGGTPDNVVWIVTKNSRTLKFASNSDFETALGHLTNA